MAKLHSVMNREKAKRAFFLSSFSLSMFLRRPYWLSIKTIYQNIKPTMLGTNCMIHSTALHLERKALQQPQQQLQKQQKTSITAAASRNIIATVASTTTITAIYELQTICSTTVLIKSKIIEIVLSKQYQPLK